MTAPAVTAPAAGFYGKVPALGDFCGRGLPPPFLRAWDEWMQSLVAHARAHCAADWPAAWMGAPVWFATLGAGIAGDGPWCAVLIPSVDRVGRLFPFSIAAACAPGGTGLDAWMLRAEALTLGALEDTFAPPRLQADLACLGPPDLRGGHGPDWPEAAAAAMAAVAPGETLWWCRGTARVPGGLVRSTGLPRTDLLARLIA